jgi:hypothetical protein
VKIESSIYLNIEIRNVKNAITTRDNQSIKKYHQDYSNQLRSPRTEFYVEGNLTILSAKISYHLLSCYFLLDLIECYYELANDTFKNKALVAANELFLLDELSVNKAIEAPPIETIYPLVDRCYKLCDQKVNVYFVPFAYRKEFVLKISPLGTILLLYPNEKKSIDRIFCEGIAEFFYKDKLKNRLPSWSRGDYPTYVHEFSLWCYQKPSKFLP